MKKAAAFVRSKFHSGTAACPFSTDLDESWTYDHELNLWEQETRAAANWTFLAPFFRSRGYYPYLWDAEKCVAVPPTVPKPPEEGEGYPYARRVYSEGTDLEFDSLTVRLVILSGVSPRSPTTDVYQQRFRIWPARDSHGHELIIRSEFFQWRTIQHTN